MGGKRNKEGWMKEKEMGRERQDRVDIMTEGKQNKEEENK